MINSLKVYADTSVFGGVYDDEFSNASKLFFDQVKAGKFHLITSAVVSEEILKAPKKVANFFNKIIEFSEIAEVKIDALNLRDKYLEANIVTKKWLTDAMHVAIATVSNCSIIVSWNFAHIVNFQKIPLYNAVNRINGYNDIGIYSPMEVINASE